MNIIPIDDHHHDDHDLDDLTIYWNDMKFMANIEYITNTNKNEGRKRMNKRNEEKQTKKDALIWRHQKKEMAIKRKKLPGNRNKKTNQSIRYLHNFSHSIQFNPIIQKKPETNEKTGQLWICQTEQTNKKKNGETQMVIIIIIITMTHEALILSFFFGHQNPKI